MVARVAQVTTHRSMSPHTTDVGILGSILAGYIIFLPVQFATGMDFRFAPSDVFLLLFLLLGINRLRFVKPAWSAWHLAMLVVFAVGTFVAQVRTGYVSRYALVQKDVGLLVLFAEYAMVTYFAANWSRIRWVLRILILSVLFQNVFFLGEFLAWPLVGLDIPWINSTRYRLTGMLVDPNAYGGLLVLTFGVHIVTYFSRRPLVSGSLGWLCSVTLGLGIVLTFSRSAWIGMAFVVLAVVVFKPGLISRIVALAISSGLAVYVAYGSFDVVRLMATRRIQIEARLETIDSAIRMFMESPMFGIGVGVFYESEGAIVHNTPIWILTEFGLLGISVFVGFNLWFASKGFLTYKLASKEYKPLILGIIIAYMAMVGLSLGIEALYQRHWWLIMGLVAATYRISRRERLSHQRGEREGETGRVG